MDSYKIGPIHKQNVRRALSICYKTRMTTTNQPLPEYATLYQELVITQSLNASYRLDRIQGRFEQEMRDSLTYQLKELTHINPIPEIDLALRLLLVVFERFEQNGNIRDLDLIDVVLRNLENFTLTGERRFHTYIFDYISCFEPAKEWGLVREEGQIICETVERSYAEIMSSR